MGAGRRPEKQTDIKFLGCLRIIAVDGRFDVIGDVPYAVEGTVRQCVNSSVRTAPIFTGKCIQRDSGRNRSWKKWNVVMRRNGFLGVLGIWTVQKYVGKIAQRRTTDNTSTQRNRRSLLLYNARHGASQFILSSLERRTLRY